MRNQQAGFTLIELVMVIVIIGILAGTALPRFVNLEARAQQAATDGVAGSLSSAAAINYASCATMKHAAEGEKCVAVDNCSDVVNLIDGVTFGTAAGNYNIVRMPIGGKGNGASADCTVGYCTAKDSCNLITASFKAIRAGR